MALSKAEVAAKRAAVLAQFQEKLERYLPESGELKSWTISAWEQALVGDLLEVGRAVTEARIAVDPLRVPESARCPACGRVLMGHARQGAHKQTLFGPLQFERTYGYCRPCRSAFSPSGSRVGFRRGLL
jgi:hypothetical protein